MSCRSAYFAHALSATVCYTTVTEWGVDMTHHQPVSTGKGKVDIERPRVLVAIVKWRRSSVSRHGPKAALD
jgi:hypothetical protein